MKDCLIVGTTTAMGYNGTRQLLINKILKMGLYSVHFSENKAISSRWYTTLTPNRPEDKTLTLTKTYNPHDYPSYDNYDAIECICKDIPIDYTGKIGVPITFFQVYDYLPYEILEYRGDLEIEGKRLFGRLIIRKK